MTKGCGPSIDTPVRVRVARVSLAASLLLAVAGPTASSPERGGTDAVRPVFGVFAGSSPCDESIRPLLRIPLQADAHLMEWNLTLYQNPETGAPAHYHLHYKYGLTVPGRPGLAPTAEAAERTGTWRMAKGTKDDSAAVVYELTGTVSLVKVSDDILHVLNGDRSVMIGDSGWSYTLNRSDASEPRVDPLLDAAPDMSYSLHPLASGPTVFGVFEGRTPCQGIARGLNISAARGCAKAKWRVTLYQAPETRDPTTYRVEGTLHRSGAREGQWSIVRGTETDSHAIVYRLAPARNEAALVLLKGDDNVLFFLDHRHRPLTGNAEFSYTLNRRKDSPPPPSPDSNDQAPWPQ